MCQVDLQSFVAQQVDGPLLAVGCFDNNPAFSAALGHGFDEDHWLVGDASAAEPLAVCVHREDGRPAAVKVASHVVFLDWSLPLFVEGVGLWKPE